MRILPPDEWDKLRDVFEKHDWHLPDPTTAFALVDEDEAGEIIVVLMVQLQLAAEPLWIAEAHRSKVDWRGMLAEVQEIVMAQNIFRGIVVHATTPQTETMAEAMGMREAKCKTYVKEFEQVQTAAAGDKE
jgi:hypothetical protein